MKEIKWAVFNVSRLLLFNAPCLPWSDFTSDCQRVLISVLYLCYGNGIEEYCHQTHSFYWLTHWNKHLQYHSRRENIHGGDFPVPSIQPTNRKCSVDSSCEVCSLKYGINIKSTTSRLLTVNSHGPWTITQHLACLHPWQWSSKSKHLLFPGLEWRGQVGCLCIASTGTEIDNQQGPTTQHREVYSIFCKNLNEKRIWKTIDIGITQSLCCKPKIQHCKSTILQLKKKEMH